VKLSVLGAYALGETSLRYAWTASTIPSGAAAPTFSANNSSAAKNTTVTFKKAGVYVFTATITDNGNRTITSSVTVTVNQTLTSITATSPNLTLSTGAVQQFTATGYDQFGNVLAVQPAFTWSASSGTITSGGLFTAPGTSCYVTVTATSSSIGGSATATILNGAPKIATSAAASSNPVTGTTTLLSVLGSDDAGESGLKYTWRATSIPSGAAAPTFSVNGVNAAKNATVSFKKAGVYVFTATIADVAGLSVTSSVTVTVNQTLAGMSVTPSTASIATGAAQQFSATALDQFGYAMTVQPAVVWATTSGTITTGGLLTAPGTAGSATVTATSGSVQGTASIAFTTLGLSDPALASLTQSLFADGSISRLDMIQILQNVAATGTVSSTDFNDLKSILAYSGTLNIPGYVQVLAGNIVNGNTANAYYQGQALGNLTAGSTGGKLTSLINKWFFGTDRPTIDANTSGVYRSASGSLFNGAPSHTNEYQGLLGDCYFIASIGVVADKSAAAIQNMFLDNGDGTWTVRFYANGVADYVTVDRMLPTNSSGYFIYANYGGMYNNSANTLWIPLAEKAYAQWNETGKEGRNGTNRYSGIEGGDPAAVLTQILGRSASSYYLSNQQTLIDAMTSNKAVTICTWSSSSYFSTYGMYGNHAYGVVGYNASNGTFTLYNPWGTNQPYSALTWAQLQNVCCVFEVADASGTNAFGTSVQFAGVSLADSIKPAAMNPLQTSRTPSFAFDEISAPRLTTSAVRLAACNEISVADRWFAQDLTDGIGPLANETAAKTAAWAAHERNPLEKSLLALDELFRQALI
jgi:hypothetical protein